jgi:hypothetical protein
VASLESDPGLSKLLALTAATVEPTIETLSVLHQAIAADSIVDRYLWPADQEVGQLWTDLDLTGRRIVASGTYYGPSRYLEVVDRITDEVLWSYEPDGRSVAIGPSFFSPDGVVVVAGAVWDQAETQPDQGVIGAFVWDAATGRMIRHIDLGPCGGFVTDVSD